MNNVDRIGKKTVEEKYIYGVVSDATKIARQAGSEEVKPEHLMSVVLRHMANAYELNKAMSEKIRQLEAELEALRRAVNNDKKE
jgi:ATP-dependent Clp protease ATP-binding subunit ClpA